MGRTQLESRHSFDGHCPELFMRTSSLNEASANKCSLGHELSFFKEKREMELYCIVYILVRLSNIAFI